VTQRRTADEFRNDLHAREKRHGKKHSFRWLRSEVLATLRQTVTQRGKTGSFAMISHARAWHEKKGLFPPGPASEALPTPPPNCDAKRDRLLSRISWGCSSQIDSTGRVIFTADAYAPDGRRFTVLADERLTAFLELHAAIHRQLELG
jgi:hypothetical protein